MTKADKFQGGKGRGRSVQASPAGREEVPTDKRRAMTPARKKRIWTAWEGKCWFCKMPVEQEGPGVVYDHIPTLWISGSDDDNDIGPIHAATCNKIKTAADLTRIAKVKRLIKSQDPEQRKPSNIRNRGFDTSLTRTFSGKVVARRARLGAISSGADND